MSLPRKDIRIKVDAAAFSRLDAIARAMGMTAPQYAEELVMAELERRVHAATVVADAARGAGNPGQLGVKRGGV